MRTIPIVYIILFALLAGSAGNTAADNWGMFRHDIQHHALTTDSAPGEVELAWRHHVAEEYYGVISSPSVVDGVVYFGSDDGNVTALNAVNGEVIWKVRLNKDSVRSSPAVDTEKGLFIINSQAVYALSLSNGSRLWNFTTGADWEFSSPLIYQGVVYIGSYDGKLYALNETSGQILWSYDTHNAPRSPNANYGGGGGIGSSPATDGTRVFFACEDNTFYAINIATHDLDWKYEFGDRISVGPADYPIGNGQSSYSSPSVDINAGLVFVGGDDGNMYAFDTAGDNDGWDNDLDGVTDDEGVLEWQYTTDGRVQSSPGFHDGKVFFGSYTDSADNVFALNETNGMPEWSYQCNGPVFSSPAITDGMVIIGSDDYNVYAFNEDNGSVMWKFATGHYVASSPAIYDGMVFIGSTDYYLYALGIPKDRPDAAVGPDDLKFPRQVTENDTVNFSCTVHNIGKENITSVNVALSIDGSSIYVDYVSLKKGENLTFYREWKAVKGNHTVNLTLSDCEPAERNLNNNMVSKAIHVNASESNETGGEPGAEPGENWTYVDFALKALTISPEIPTDGEEVTAMAEVKNSGNGTGEGTLKIYLDSEDGSGLIHSLDLTLSPGESESYTTTFTVSAGEHTLYAVVDCDNDTSDNNNRATLSFTVEEGYIGPAPDLNVRNIILMKEDGGAAVNVKEGDTLSVQILVSNDGDRDALMDFYLYDGDPSLNQILSYQSTTIRAGKSRTLFVVWAPTAGNHTLYAVAGSRTTDSNPDNNMKSVSISVGPKEKKDDSGGFISVYPPVVLGAVGAAFVLFLWSRRGMRRRDV